MCIRDSYKIKENPLSWLDHILNAPDHTNFFEGRVTEYTVAGLTGKFNYDFVEAVA